MAPLAGETAISAKRAELAGKAGIYGLISNKKTSAIGLFASLGGLVYGYNQGMFAQVLTMHSFSVAVCIPEPRTSRELSLTLADGWICCDDRYQTRSPDLCS